MQNSASSLAEKLRARTEKERQATEALFQENFHALQQHLQASSKSALATTENAILESLAQLEQNISSRCRTMGTVFSRPCRLAFLWSCAILIVSALSIWGLLMLSQYRIKGLTGDFQPECPAGTAGSAKCLALEQLQGAGAVSGRRQDLSSDASGTADRQCGQGGPTGRLGSGAEVTHDRNGKDAERKFAGPGRRSPRSCTGRKHGFPASRPAWRIRDARFRPCAGRSFSYGRSSRH